MRVVIALGGNALLLRGERPDARTQLIHIKTAATALAPLIRDHDVVLCHGNGPQVGLLALESGADESLTHPYPLDVLGAQTQGMIGYWLSQSLRNAGVSKQVVNVTTQTVVDGDDASFTDPTKPIGPIYAQSQARDLAREHGWTVAADGASWRRVVPSPQPIRLVEQPAIDLLINSGCVVICGGGGGAPVVEESSGRLRGVEAVVDKDLTATLLAEAIDADHLLVLTDVAGVVDRYGTPQSSPLAQVYTDELDPRDFAAGSMGPKVRACIDFVTRTGRSAAIGALIDPEGVLAGRSGTTILDRPTVDAETGRAS